MPSSDTTPASLSEDTKVRTNINRLLTWGVGLVVGTSVLITFWNKQENNVANLTASDHVQDVQLIELKAQVTSLVRQVDKVEANQNAQTEILKYLARGRPGPVPDAAK
jgi:hypothetical protein